MTFCRFTNRFADQWQIEGEPSASVDSFGKIEEARTGQLSFWLIRNTRIFIFYSGISDYNNEDYG